MLYSSRESAYTILFKHCSGGDIHETCRLRRNGRSVHPRAGKARLHPVGRQRRRCDFRPEQPFRRVQPRSESLSPRGELPRKRRDRPACPRRVHLPHGQYGALGRPPRLRPAERTARNGACLRPRQGERCRHRGIGQQQPLDARRHLRLAGRRKRLHRHLLVKHRPQYACLGRQRLPHRQ